MSAIENKVCHHPFLDRRENLFALSDPKLLKDAERIELQKQARSVACMIDEAAMEYDPEKGVWRLKDATKNLEQMWYCSPYDPKAKFGTEPRVSGYGTGFLVTKKVVATAAHCICKDNSFELDRESIAKIRVVFDFQMKNATECQREFAQVYSIAKVVAWNFNPKTYVDWALLELDSEVAGRDPLSIRSEAKTGEGVYMLGHPDAIPLKYTYGEQILKVTDDFIYAALDGFKGNSGSPVFDHITKQVIGILIRGRKDYKWDKDKQCYVINRLSNTIEESGYSQRIKVVFHLIREIIAENHERAQSIIDQISCRVIEGPDGKRFLEPLDNYNGVMNEPKSTIKKIKDCSERFSEDSLSGCTWM